MGGQVPRPILHGISVVALPITWTLVVLRLWDLHPRAGDCSTHRDWPLAWRYQPRQLSAFAMDGTTLPNFRRIVSTLSIAALRTVQPLPLAAAVAGTWLVLALDRRWRPEPSWIDLTARCLGVYWLARVLSCLSCVLSSHRGASYVIADSLADCRARPVRHRGRLAGEDPEVEVARSSLPSKPRFTLSDHKDVVWCVAFSPDGKSLVTCSGDRDAKAGEMPRLWSLQAGKPVHKFLVEESRGIRWFSFAPDGKTLATAEYDGMVKFRDASTGKVLTKFEAHPGGVQCLKFAPDGKTLVTCGKDNTAKVWDVTTRKATMTMKGHSNHVYSLDLFVRPAYFADREQRLHGGTVGRGDGRIDGNRSWHHESGQVVRFSPDGNYFAVAGWDGMVIIWSTETENHVRTLGSPGGGILAMAFTPDSKHLAIGTDTGLLRVWQVPTWKMQGTLKATMTTTSAVLHSPRTAS